MLKIKIKGTQDDKPYEQESSHFESEILMVPILIVLSVIKEGCKLSKAKITSIELYKDNLLVKSFSI